MPDGLGRGGVVVGSDPARPGGGPAVDLRDLTLVSGEALLVRLDTAG